MCYLKTVILVELLVLEICNKFIFYFKSEFDRFIKEFNKARENGFNLDQIKTYIII